MGVIAKESASDQTIVLQERPALGRAAGLAWLAVVLAVTLYCYPSLRARWELHSTVLPPMFSPDLTLYVNLSLPPSAGGQFTNPYYLVSVPSSGAGYLKFRLAPALFSSFHQLIGDLWLSIFVWNTVWWSALAIIAGWLFRRFLPAQATGLPAIGVLTLMLFNFGVLKSLLAAWAHLPSVGAFDQMGLPFMRAFVPVIPATLLLTYLGLQMEILRRERIAIWIGLVAVQFSATAIFPYATLMMVGITAASAWLAIRRQRDNWRRYIAYGVICGVMDALYTVRGSLGFYSGHTSLLRLDLGALPHLVGGSWLLLLFVTLGVAYVSLTPALKWPLVGLGAMNLVLLLGDAVVPAKTILLSHHAAHFMHETMTILLVFLLAVWVDRGFPRASGLIAALAVILITNGILLTIGNYRGFKAYNLKEAALASALQGKLQPGDLVLARSRFVDDPCGWIYYLTQHPVLFCTDAEVMLTPEQNLSVHRFRQALYLYFTDRSSVTLLQALQGNQRLNVLWELGYWAEAVSPSEVDQLDGVRRVQSELVPLLENVERKDRSVEDFFRKYQRLVVLDDLNSPTFSAPRLAEYLVLKNEQTEGTFEIRTYTPR